MEIDHRGSIGELSDAMAAGRRQGIVRRARAVRIAGILQISRRRAEFVRQGDGLCFLSAVPTLVRNCGGPSLVDSRRLHLKGSAKL